MFILAEYMTFLRKTAFVYYFMSNTFGDIYISKKYLFSTQMAYFNCTGAVLDYSFQVPSKFSFAKIKLL